jgi:hypothetical protein
MLSALAERMRYLRSLRQFWLRFIDWRLRRHAPAATAFVPDFIAIEPTLSRDVSRKGIRFYSLCAACGCRLAASATLCEECAHRRSREPWT